MVTSQQAIIVSAWVGVKGQGPAILKNWSFNLLCFTDPGKDYRWHDKARVVGVNGDE